MWLITIKAPQKVVYTLSEALEYFSDSVAIFEDKINQTIWHLQALTMIQPLRDELENFVKKISHQHRTLRPTVTISEVPAKDWLVENQKTFTPQIIGPFYIHNTHHQNHLPQNKICLQIDASTAFGTGHHGTTQGCLEAIDILHENGITFKNIIDIGTGTGILAIACAKLFGLPIFATEIDSEAIRKASENILLNDCKTQVTLFQADGLTHPDLTPYQPFDLVITNILANTLIELAPSIAQATQPKSILILSGLLQEQIDSVRRAFHAYQFILKKSIIHNKWATLILSASLI